MVLVMPLGHSCVVLVDGVISIVSENVNFLFDSYE